MNLEYEVRQLSKEILNICKKNSKFKKGVHCDLEINNFKIHTYTNYDMYYYTFTVKNFLQIKKFEFTQHSTSFSFEIFDTNYNPRSILTILKCLKKELTK